jgi:hypothetical protein
MDSQSSDSGVGPWLLPPTGAADTPPFLSVIQYFLGVHNIVDLLWFAHLLDFSDSLVDTKIRKTANYKNNLGKVMKVNLTFLYHFYITLIKIYNRKTKLTKRENRKLFGLGMWKTTEKILPTNIYKEFFFIFHFI